MTSGINGLTSQEVEKSRSLHGDNSLKKEKGRGFLKRFLETLSDPIIRILMIALILQVVFTFGNPDYFEICGIVVAIFLSTFVSTISEYRSEKAFERLNDEGLDGEVCALRDGSLKRIRSSDIVVGDILYISVGEKIQADAEVLSGKISVDQSALNGESIECIKYSSKSRGWDLSDTGRVFRGSVVTNGNAIIRVLRVGTETYYGLIAKDVQTETRLSPLKLRLGRLAEQISKIGYVVAIIVGLSYLFNAIILDNDFDMEKIKVFLGDFKTVMECIINAVTLMITVTVVAAPEGLPMMITVVLSANMKKMLSDNILVKKLVGIETAGSMNILFTDKTGTITVGKPECERFITVSGSCKGMNSLRKMTKIHQLLSISAKYNSDVVMVGNEITGGNATDRAIWGFFASEDTPKYLIESKDSFSSEKKYSSVSLKNGIIVTKGAAEIILASSKKAINENGDIVPFDPKSIYHEYLSAVESGQRVIGVAFKDKNTKENIFVALIVMKDKIRQDVYSSVREVTRAGIQIVMVTGDGRETATSIAEECGILNKKAGHLVITSEDLHRMTDEEIKAILPKIRVISRALPQDKTRLVRLSQEMNLVVGMTGDGINDAPSLKLADVGFSMGSGTDIAKSASDIVILDNSFLAISRTILYGRTIFKSIRKFITFQLTMNLAACGVSLVGQFVGVDTPITIIQMLWVNIIMDTLGGLAFAGEPPLNYYMQEKPKSRDEEILSADMMHQICLCGVYSLVLCIAFLSSKTIRIMYGGLIPTDKFYTAFYVLFIFLGIFNCFSARCSRLWILSNIGKNKPFVFIMILISVIQICMVYFGGTVFRCVPLLPYELSFVILLASSVIPFEMARRLIYKLK
jgi:calcium-translocating P-type ATPase